MDSCWLVWFFWDTGGEDSNRRTPLSKAYVHTRFFMYILTRHFCLCQSDTSEDTEIGTKNEVVVRVSMIEIANSSRFM